MPHYGDLPKLDFPHLVDQTGTLIGYGCVPHLKRAGMYMDLLIYQTDTEYVLCLREGGGDMAEHTKTLAEALGQPCRGAQFALLAEECFPRSEVSLPLLKDMIRQGVRTMEVVWLHEGD